MPALILIIQVLIGIRDLTGIKNNQTVGRPNSQQILAILSVSLCLMYGNAQTAPKPIPTIKIGFRHAAFDFRLSGITSTPTSVFLSIVVRKLV